MIGTPNDKLGYRNAGFVPRDDARLTKSIKNESLKSLAEGYSRNLDRLFSLHLLPIHLLKVGMLRQKFHDWAVFEVMGRLIEDNEIGQDREEEVHEAFVRIARQHMDQEAKASKTIAEMNAQSKASGGMFTVSLVAGPTDGEVWFSNQINNGDSATIAACETILGAMLTGAFSAFGSLAEDAWVTCVNLRPTTISQNLLDSTNIKGTDKAEQKFHRTADSKAGERKSVSLQDLIDMDFDISEKAGQLYVLARKVSFATMESTARAYLNAFREPFLNKVWRSHAFRQMFILEQVRHLFAHQSGLVDKNFTEKISRLSKDPVSMEQIEIPGSIASAKVGPNGERPMLALERDWVPLMLRLAITAGTELLEFVDTWMTENGSMSA